MIMDSGKVKENMQKGYGCKPSCKVKTDLERRGEGIFLDCVSEAIQ